jgi:hypothetical protein
MPGIKSRFLCQPAHSLVTILTEKLKMDVDSCDKGGGNYF